MVVTLMSRLSLGLLIVIPVGVTLVVAWPVILIAAMIVVLSKGTDAWRRPPTSPPRGLTNDFAEGGWRIDRENGLLNGQWSSSKGFTASRSRALAPSTAEFPASGLVGADRVLALGWLTRSCRFAPSSRA